MFKSLESFLNIGSPMLDKLLNLIKPELGLPHLVNILAEVTKIISLLDENYLKDKNAFNAAIDTIIQLLEGQKQK